MTHFGTLSQKESLVGRQHGLLTPVGARHKPGYADSVKPRALIVDDDVAECEMLADVLRDAGFEPHCEIVPARALELVQAQRFDVVLTDHIMPEMSGTQLCSRLKQLAPQLPVVVVTAFGGFSLATEAAQAGAAEFLAKPFDIDTIGDILRRAMKSAERAIDRH